MVSMQTFLVPLTFPDLDSAKRDGPSLLDALQIAGVDAELASEPTLESEDAGRRDPGPTTRQFRVRAESVEDAGRRVQVVTEGQFPPGMVLMGEPTPL